MWLRRSPGGWHVSATLIRGLQLLKQGLGPHVLHGQAGTSEGCNKGGGKTPEGSRDV